MLKRWRNNSRLVQQLYDKLRAEPSIVVNGFKNVGIVEAVKKARENPLSIESNENSLPPSEEDRTLLTAALKMRIMH